MDTPSRTSTRRPRVVAALGGNALLRRGEPLDADTQRRNVDQAALALAAIAAECDLVITHGNGPQVGLLALQEASTEAPAYPLDILGAESEGMIGYLLEVSLRNLLPEREIATLLTQVVVAPADPAFAHPTKPIGPVYTEIEAKRLAVQHGWTVAPDGSSFRRVVPSPEPREIVELETIRALVDAGVLVICAGGGGIPVVEEHGMTFGVEAVIDKDLVAALLAERIDADVLLILTDVEAVVCDWRTPAARPLGPTTTTELRSLEFADGSMAPKVEAACRFTDRTGRRSAIGSLSDTVALLGGEGGTQIVRSGSERRRDLAAAF